jgi:hypothetical protein
MNGRVRGGAAEAGADVEMEGEFTISDVSDNDILEEFMRRDLITHALPTIPDTSSPQVLICGK